MTSKTNLDDITDVGMVDLGQEADLWRSHGILFRKKELQTENTI